MGSGSRTDPLDLFEFMNPPDRAAPKRTEFLRAPQAGSSSSKPEQPGSSSSS